MHLEAYIADCSDGGLISDLQEAGVDPAIQRKYLYATGADDPGIWLVCTFVASSILGGFVHDAFKIALRKTIDFARRRAISIEGDIDDDGPGHTCMVLKSEGLEIEIALGDSDIDSDWIESVVKRCEAIVTIFENEGAKCIVNLPVKEYPNHWSYSRHISKSAYRYWMLYWKDGETIVYDDKDKIFHRNASA
jgi:hypothetical protein